ncbi:YlxQ family RNA-binding protein [Listeria monocytogenes]|nr:YlxQ family RNA-binding protein [Listeria monocytogenes]
MDKKALSLLGLANRARKITTGEELVLKAVRNGKAKMVLISEDISEKTEKTIRNKCEYYNVVVKKVGTREMIGGAIGKDTRAIVAILDKGFAIKLAELLG